MHKKRAIILITWAAAQEIKVSPIAMLNNPSAMTKPLAAAVDRKGLPSPCTARTDLFSIFAVVAFAVVLAGFARTLFLRFLFGLPSMPVYLYVHGLLFSAWFVLFFIQTRLIASRRVDLHRRLGTLGAVIAGLGVPVAIGVAIHAGKRVYETQSKPFSMEAPPLALDLGACLAFTVFIGIALYLRRRSDVHKRLMLLASFCPRLGEYPVFST